MKLQVNAHSIGTKLYRLEISHNGQFIGEYERAQKDDIARKKEEIDCASELLLDIYRKKGAFVVRWDIKRRLKSIRVNGVEVDQIPRNCWLKPSRDA